MSDVLAQLGGLTFGPDDTRSLGTMMFAAATFVQFGLARWPEYAAWYAETYNRPKPPEIAREELEDMLPLMKAIARGAP